VLGGRGLPAKSIQDGPLIEEAEWRINALKAEIELANSY
jgi:hypothetical protein